MPSAISWLYYDIIEIQSFSSGRNHQHSTVSEDQGSSTLESNSGMEIGPLDSVLLLCSFVCRPRVVFLGEPTDNSVASVAAVLGPTLIVLSCIGVGRR